MLEFNPNIVHFCGHGEGEAGIAFENEEGKTKLISSDALAGFFELFSETIDCIILNSCYSESQAKAISKKIKYVIGMNSSISDKAAIEFSTAFYDSICSGKSIEFSYKIACNSMIWTGLSESQIPIFLQSDNNKFHKPEKSSLMELHLKPKMLCLLLLETSGSMAGEPIEELNQGLRLFLSDLRSNPNTLEHVELALVTFSTSASIRLLS